jgi:hypothetical protein
MYWLIVGFGTSAITLHIATLLLLDKPSLAKAVAVAASVWLTTFVLVLAHVGHALLYSLAGLVVGCVLLKRLYGVGVAQALVVFLVHGVVEVAVGLLLWFMVPTLLGREHRSAPAAGAGSDSAGGDGRARRRGDAEHAQTLSSAGADRRGRPTPRRRARPTAC